MNTKMSKRQRDLKAKLMAAIAMLLVSSIMMVSTTYAWFTLSTAPEVTGITTAVGANGNLEMALLPVNVDLNKLDDASVITSAVGDSQDASGQTVAEANITWGNLVDLKDNTIYGLDEIKLMPAALHLKPNSVTEENPLGIIGGNPLDRPAYGVDGRVTELKNDVLTGIYASDAFYENQNYYGVRGVGTSSSMSPRQLAHRSLVQDGNSLTSQAKSTASNALAQYGADLAGLAIDKVNGATKYPRADVEKLYAVVTELDRAMGQVETAIKSYAAANAIAPATAEANYAALQTQVLDMTLEEIKSSAYATTGMSEAITKLSETRTSVSGAVTGLKDLLYTKDSDGKYTETKTSATEFTWEQIQGALTKILNVDQLKLNGFAMNKVKEKETVDNGDGTTTEKFKNIGEIAKKVLKEGIQLQMPNGSGAYADLAEFCGDYGTIIFLPEGVVIESIDLGGMEAEMKTECIGAAETQIAASYLSVVSSNKATFGAAEGASTANAITEFYGYIIDLAFRTNVADSNLLLQTAAQNRIYSNNTENAEIMGGGSTMTFTGAAGFNAVSVKNLMEHLSIVFFEPDTKVILAHAGLDTDNAEVEGNTVTAEMYLKDKTNLIKDSTNAKIVALEQNKAKAVSVLVYLDGETITNADVANATESMTGSVNLQFASSATLVPMDYSDLKQGNGGNSTSRVTYTAMNDGKVTVADAAKNAGVELVTSYLVSQNDTAKGIGVVLDGVPAGQDVYLSINGAGAVKATKGSYSGFTGYGITAEGLTADTIVEVSLQAATTTEPTTPSQPTVTEHEVTFSAGETGVTSNGAAKATANAAYNFTLTGMDTEAYDYTVSYSVANGDQGTLSGTDGAYSIPGDKVTGNITITVTASAKQVQEPNGEETT